MDINTHYSLILNGYPSIILWKNIIDFLIRRDEIYPD